MFLQSRVVILVGAGLPLALAPLFCAPLPASTYFTQFRSERDKSVNIPTHFIETTLR